VARPKSNGKRKAILDAAFLIFAERGVGNTPTAAISAAAGISEGSLFTYFHTKAELINELYLEMRSDFSREMAEFPERQDARTRLRYIWDGFLSVGIGQPDRLRVIRQIRASGKLLKENEKASGMILETLNAVRDAVLNGAFHDAPIEFMVLQLRGQAEATIEFILAHPEQEKSCRELGFELLWRGLTG
jgi:AcrR family transcriptional regulator